MACALLKCNALIYKGCLVSIEKSAPKILKGNKKTRIAKKKYWLKIKIINKSYSRLLIWWFIQPPKMMFLLFYSCQARSRRDSPSISKNSTQYNPKPMKIHWMTKALKLWLQAITHKIVFPWSIGSAIMAVLSVKRNIIINLYMFLLVQVLTISRRCLG